LHAPNEDFKRAAEHDIELGINSEEQLNRALTTAAIQGKQLALHLKVDTGLSRNGVSVDQWPSLVTAAKSAAETGHVRIVGVFSHLSSTSTTDDTQQIVRFEMATALAKVMELDFEMRHLTASDGTLSYPHAAYEMVRIGIALYGLSPFSDNRGADYDLIPAMTAKSVVVHTKRVPDNTPVGYGYDHRTVGEATLALVPVGYAEGLPRAASPRGKVRINGKTYRIAARVAMDQFVVDVGNDEVNIGDEVLIFGDPAAGAPSADDLALASRTINYEIVTRMGGRFERVYVGEVDAGGNVANQDSLRALEAARESQAPAPMLATSVDAAREGDEFEPLKEAILYLDDFDEEGDR
jgi:alanine racemase